VIAQVTRLGVTTGSEDEQRCARESIERNCCVTLPRFFAPDLLQWFQRQIAAAPFETRVHRLVDPPPVDLMMVSPPILSRLHFLINDARLFTLVEELTGCDPIGCFLGTVYKMVPGQGHYDAWHHDANESRMVTLSVNLSDAPYEGGVLQIMNWQERRLVHQVANTGPGDAILFPVGLEWRHCLTEVTGTVPKIALAGWFEREPRYVDRFPRPRA
jgi:hypothetical protein